MAVSTNTPPNAENDVFSTKAGDTLVIRTTEILFNDVDANRDSLIVTGINAFSNGSAFYVPEDGVIVFRPDDYFVGNASFNYSISDGHGGVDTAMVTINVEAEQLTPIALTLAEDTRIVVTQTDLSAMGGATEFDQPDHGRVVLELVDGGPTANIVYIPNSDYFGSDNFTLSYVTRFDGGVVQKQVDLTVTPVDEPTPLGTYFRGTASADTLDYATATTRVLIAGLDGNDTLRGGAGNDALNGGAGNDIITGGAGNDSITGGLGSDRMGGGAGNDTFHIARGDLAVTGPTDLIVDFQGAGQAGGDVIRFSGFAAASTLELVGTSGNARVYEVHDTAGVSEGQLLVSAGGALGNMLTTSDYAFA